MNSIRNFFQSMSCTSARATRDVAPKGENLALENQASNTKMSINNRDINPDTTEQRDVRSPSTKLFTQLKEKDEEISKVNKEISKIDRKLKLWSSEKLKQKKIQLKNKRDILLKEKRNLTNQYTWNAYRSEDLKGASNETSHEVQLLRLLKVEEKSLAISRESKKTIAEIKSKQKDMVIDNNKFFNKSFADIRVKDNSKLNIALTTAAAHLLDIPLMWMGNNDTKILANGVTESAVTQIGENFNNASKISGEIRAVLETRDVDTIKAFINTKLEEYPEYTHEQLNNALKALNKLG